MPNKKGNDRKFFVGGNWKMNGNQVSIEKIKNFLVEKELPPGPDIVVAPPSCYLMYAKSILPPRVAIATQNCYINPDDGAFTGEINAKMAKDCGASWVITGHSERRHILKEDDETVALKTKVALDEGLAVIPCVGEKLEEREAGKTEEVVERQLKAIKAKINDWSRVVIAYEPVWAIGTGKTATPQQAEDVHKFIREWLHKNEGLDVANHTRIIYGGSVKGANADELAKQPNIDGFLVGGASLTPDFLKIIQACA